MSTWRERARSHIRATAAAYRGPDESLETHLREHYPFGPREHYPYKVWCEELNRFLRTTAHPLSEYARLQAWNAGEPIVDWRDWS